MLQPFFESFFRFDTVELPASPVVTKRLRRGRQRGFIGVKVATRFLATKKYAPPNIGKKRLPKAS
ncbi:hypothetical protein [Kaarinaea lacus]